MKVYILFKVKDMSKQKKEFIIDSLYTTRQGALRREMRVHKWNLQSWAKYRSEFNSQVLDSKQQQTYIITKSLKGLIPIRNKKGKVVQQIGLK